MKKLITILFTFLFLSSFSQRDMEADAKAYTSIILLRENTKQALFFSYKSNQFAKQIRIGILLDPGTGTELDNWKSYVILYRIDNPAYILTGANTFTFGVNGVDIYLKYNGVEVAHLKDWRYMKEGPARGINTTDFVLRNLPTKSLYSDFPNKIVDVRDFGFKQGTTTGTIVAGSPVLNVTSNPGYQVGNTVIVESNALRGNRGVGGQWPAKSYKDSLTMKADSLQPNNLYAYREDNGYTYYNTYGKWKKLMYTIDQSGHWLDVNYYLGKAVPIALRAKIVAMSCDGLTIILDKAAVTTTTANIYFDNSYVLSKLGADPVYDDFPDDYPTEHSLYRTLTKATDTGYTISLPAGRYAIGEPVFIINHPYLKIKGAGELQTTLFSPKGTPDIQFDVSKSAGFAVSDYSLEGNARAEGYGLFVWTWEPNWKTKIITQYVTGQYPYLPNAQMFTSCPDLQVSNMTIKDVYAGAVAPMYSARSMVKNVHVVMTEGVFMYIGWALNCIESPDCTFEDCSMNSVNMIGAFQTLKSTNTKFIRSTSVNGLFASNNGDNFTFDSANATITRLGMSVWKHRLDPVVNINTNMAQGGIGGVVDHFHITIEPYTDSINDVLGGFFISGTTSDITIKNSTYTAPDWITPALNEGAVAVKSTSVNTTIDNLIVVGKVRQDMPPGLYRTNIGLTSGAVRNSSAYNIDVNAGVILQNNTATFINGVRQ